MSADLKLTIRHKEVGSMTVAELQDHLDRVQVKSMSIISPETIHTIPNTTLGAGGLQ